MAELKKAHQYSYDYVPIEDPMDEQHDELNIDQMPEFAPEVEEEVIISISPAKRLKRFTNLEKILVVGLALVVVALSVMTIKLRTNISSVERDISGVTSTIATNKSEISRLEQEKNELSRSERVKKIAEKQGLTINDDNLRKVK
ncbi:cell division protein FtsL [Enterococcus phoeniculicola]|jgi:cell division protein FtsL|uniref:Cell division protein FtsL n=1 Tax=Enterococcus phoeniculicola ATCC BAA-412 TaxID=1158610 RepID=R3WM75_9ENTE|nr:cell division protein FtsL [Enterococcus phoeniculicola]EOL48931.1 cell division protein FtsL [Enterococcus phoeniculicola ATCC BAA-412]EOT72777.1 cell division protein FtsL [Enterococcus phoeniculicola ATCC BAA-412]OJG70824.1 cell division protein FtsL [Enterococcus phoeniculicola]